MRVGPHDLDEHVLVIAEVGNNHEGDVDFAREAVRQAAAAGVDAIKFQTLRAELLVGVSDEKRLAQLRRYQLEPEAFEELAELARAQGILFISTPLDLGSLELIARIGDAIKIASGDNDFYPLIERAAASDKPLILSTGASDLATVERAVAAIDAVRPAGNLAVLHAVSSYPTPPEEANVLAVRALAERFPQHTVGYSDHVLGPEAAVLSVAAGARVIEKHFTLEGVESDFRDHALSATPPEMAELVRRVREAERLLGRPEKAIADAEAPTAQAIRRSIVAAADLPEGHVVRPDDLTWVRPGTGLRPGQEELLVGRALRRAVAFGDQLREDDVA